MEQEGTNNVIELRGHQAVLLADGGVSFVDPGQ